MSNHNNNTNQQRQNSLSGLNQSVINPISGIANGYSGYSGVRGNGINSSGIRMNPLGAPLPSNVHPLRDLRQESKAELDDNDDDNDILHGMTAAPIVNGQLNHPNQPPNVTAPILPNATGLTKTNQAMRTSLSRLNKIQMEVHALNSKIANLGAQDDTLREQYLLNLRAGIKKALQKEEQLCMIIYKMHMHNNGGFMPYKPRVDCNIDNALLSNPTNAKFELIVMQLNDAMKSSNNLYNLMIQQKMNELKHWGEIYAKLFNRAKSDINERLNLCKTMDVIDELTREAIIRVCCFSCWIGVCKDKIKCKCASLCIRERRAANSRCSLVSYCSINKCLMHHGKHGNIMNTPIYRYLNR
eukprot:31444_1